MIMPSKRIKRIITGTGMRLSFMRKRCSFCGRGKNQGHLIQDSSGAIWKARFVGNHHLQANIVEIEECVRGGHLIKTEGKVK